MPLNYLTCEKNGAIDMQHNNNNKGRLQLGSTLVSDVLATICWPGWDEAGIPVIKLT